VSKNVIIVGGGLAALAASVYLARAGRTVTIFEKRRQLGGRAITHLRRGFRFNLGPHAVYRAGAACDVYRELGVPVRGGRVAVSGTALVDGTRYRLPTSFLSLLTSGLLSARAKLEATNIFWRLRKINSKEFASMTTSQWLDANVSNTDLRRMLEAMIRLATYSDHPEQQSAAVALDQLRLSTRGVIYVDEGWQKLVDALHSHAVAAGVNFVATSRIVGVEHDGAVRGVELGGLELEDRNDTLSVAMPEMPPEGVIGTLLKADTVLLTVDPATARELVGGVVPIPAMTPVTATCLDVALSSLPVPKMKFALGIDRPLYFSVHSAYAQLTPRGGALIHVAKYRKQRAAIVDDEIETDEPVRPGDAVAADEQELEFLLDDLQPGWRDVLVHRRFLPSMTVANVLVTPSTKRPAVTTPLPGLYLAGDWVGEEGILSDASLASARAAAKAILGSDR
jgi:phytoene dehydrogenase-like protein